MCIYITGAGFLYKRGKSAAVWSKRYFTLTDHKMCYFLEQDRTVMKGEIILAGALAAESSSRASRKKKKYFTITHPQCGSREFYAKSNTRRSQWIEKINDISAALQSGAVYGKLYKQGGLSKNVWQERWCIICGPTLDYFEQASDNQSKGSIRKLTSLFYLHDPVSQSYIFCASCVCQSTFCFVCVNRRTGWCHSG